MVVAQQHGMYDTLHTDKFQASSKPQRGAVDFGTRAPAGRFSDPISTTGRLRRFLRRTRQVLLVSTLVLILLAFLAGGIGWAWLQGEVDAQVRARLSGLAVQFGGEASVGAVDIGIDGTVTISDVVFERDSSSVRLFEVRILVDPTKVIKGQRLGAIDGIIIDGVRLRERGDPGARALFERMRGIARSAQRSGGQTTIASGIAPIRIPYVKIRDVVMSTDGHTFATARFEGQSDERSRFRWTASGTVDVGHATTTQGPIGFRASGTTGPRLTGRATIDLDRPLTVSA
ncbi:MAG: hypothetical protein ACI9OJ_005219, partial [Myxococcota bacterium]